MSEWFMATLLASPRLVIKVLRSEANGPLVQQRGQFLPAREQLQMLQEAPRLKKGFF